MPLWNALMEAGRDLDVRAGCPNLIERIEGGLLSYGNDMTARTRPMNAGWAGSATPQTAIGCIGRDALLRVAKEGPVKQIRAIEIDGEAVPPCDRAWPLMAGKKQVGRDLGRAGRRISTRRGHRHGAHDPLGRGHRAARADPRWTASFPRRCAKSFGIRNRMLRREFTSQDEQGRRYDIPRIGGGGGRQGQKSASVQCWRTTVCPRAT
jgi:hypothetical protein